MTEDQKLDAPERQIAPWTTVRVMPSERHIQIIQHSEHRIELDIEGAMLLVQWLERAGLPSWEDGTVVWPGIVP